MLKIRTRQAARAPTERSECDVLVPRAHALASALVSDDDMAEQIVVDAFVAVDPRRPRDPNTLAREILAHVLTGCEHVHHSPTSDAEIPK